MFQHRNISRWGVRSLVLILATVAALDLLFANASVYLPALSPFLTLNSVIARHSIGWLAVLCLPIVIASVLRRRFFCVWLCPMGLVAECAGKLRGRRGVRRFPRLAPWIVLIVFVGAALGYPFGLWLDPLSIFNGFVGALRPPYTLAQFYLGTMFVLVATVWMVWPNAWCYRICPLGYSQELLWELRKRIRPRRRQASPVRLQRRYLLGAVVGAACAVVGRRLGARQASPLRPPGAAPEQQFSAMCARCGNCLRSCPTKILKPDLGDSGVFSLLTPVVEFRDDYCHEDCNACMQVCPTGAIAQFPLTKKIDATIGLAEIESSLCIAHVGEYCAFCLESCPFEAITEDYSTGYAVPLVDPSSCPGCGKCIFACPVEGAIVVRPGKKAMSVDREEGAGRNELPED